MTSALPTLVLVSTLIAVGVLTTAAIRALGDQRPAATGPAVGHPEHIQYLTNPNEEEAYWDLVDHLLADPEEPRLPDVIERWMR
ncbi:hypothetical protein [Actinomadura litoris]|uniref:Uncharacterized protein n=1 Tax=Actinomadura litoris TaxID=2678616 RepID=A0A7K1LAL9_9ACTN|nr:hypothetical protein [Actinomadura litoris]MUN41481.1 hypothetical protein [Actinomadura litoris]